MKRFLMVLLFAASLGNAAAANPTSVDPAKVPAGTYVLDKRHASLVVKIPHMGGFSRYTMRFNGLEGEFTYDPTAWQATHLTIEVDPLSIDTGDTSFNKTIAGYFDAAKYPKVTFVSQSVTAGENGAGKVDGDLSFHGVTKPVTLDVTFNGVGPGLLGLGTRVGFSGVARIKRSDFGVSEARQFAGDDVDVIFEVEFVKQ